MASTILVNTINTQSGTTITIPTGKTLAVTDAGALTIGGVAITTGSLGTISKTAAYTILPADFTGKSNLVVFVNVAAGTDTDTIITLPAASAFGTCAINVVSTAAHGSGNKVTIKNASAVEQYTLYKALDHCEFVSDGTNVFRTGNEHTTIFTSIAWSSDESYGGAAYHRMALTATTIVANLGAGWHTTNDEYTCPHDGQMTVGSDMRTNTGSSAANPALYRDTGSGFSIFRGEKAASAGSASSGWAYWVFDVTAGHIFRPYYYNNTGSSEGPAGSGTLARSQFTFKYNRRY